MSASGVFQIKLPSRSRHIVKFSEGQGSFW